MKSKTIFLAIILSSVLSVNAQVFNTGQTLKPGKFSLGVEPSIIINGNSDFMLFFHGGYGLKSGTDFGLTLGVLNGDTYIGGDVEFTIAKRISLSAGAHHWGNFGLDATLLGTLPITKAVNFFGGLDTDINFIKADTDGDGDKETDTKFLLWLPLGVEVGLRSNLAFIFEASVGLTDPAYHLIGGGVVVYF
ncbi:MAG TPA: hypothetical protein PK990_10145 [Salinivirgaceae bacterium]|nr:hypothetical protein [Salinivirgaceae bacterium]